MSYSRRQFLGTTAMTIAAAELATSTPAKAASSGKGIRRFRVDVPGWALADLRRRISSTRWPDYPAPSGPGR